MEKKKIEEIEEAKINVNISLDDFRKKFERYFPNFILRIREDKTVTREDNNESNSDLVYYNGNKVFKVSSDGNYINLSFPINTYKCNTASVVKSLSENIEYKNYKNDLIALCEGMETFFKFKMPLIKYEYSTDVVSGKKKFDQNRFENFKKEVERINPKVKVVINDNKKEITFDNLKKVKDIIEIQYSFIEKVRLTDSKSKRDSIKNCDFKEFSVESIDDDIKYELDELANLNDEKSFINIIMKSIDKYIGKNELEKKYQHQFMLHGDKLKSLFKDKKVVYPFEQEYGIIGRKKIGRQKNKSSYKTGRVDAVFYALNDKSQLSDIYFIELKVNRDVVGGSNGIMTHLDDINHFFKVCIQKGCKQPDIVKKRIKYRYDTLYDANIDFADKINYYFYTVIGFTEDKNDDRSKVLDFLKALNNVDEAKSAMESYTVDEQFHKYTLKTIAPSPEVCEVKFFYEEKNWEKDKEISDTFKEYILN